MVIRKNNFGTVEIWPFTDTEAPVPAGTSIEIFTREDMATDFIVLLGGAHVHALTGSLATRREDWEQLKAAVEKAFELVESRLA